MRTFLKHVPQVRSLHVIFTKHEIVCQQKKIILELSSKLLGFTTFFFLLNIPHHPTFDHQACAALPQAAKRIGLSGFGCGGA